MDKSKANFKGWATRHGLLCSDGRTIVKDAFKHQDGEIVPMLWSHDRSNPENTLGNILLEHRDEGMYAYGFFNDTESGKLGKMLVEHGDIRKLSICANKLKQKGGMVLHGMIREVSLVHSGANPGAYIESVLAHDEEGESEQALIYSGEAIEICHSEEMKTEKTEEEKKEMADTITNTVKHEEDETVQDVVDSMTEKQRNVMYALIGQAVEDATNNEEDDNVKHNVFDNDTQEQQQAVLTHDDLKKIMQDAKRIGSLKEAFLQHFDGDAELMHAVTDEKGNTVNYGIANIDYLFPDARKVNNVPDFIQRDMGWVAKVMQGAKHLPFSRVKSVHADITMEEARAKGYLKGNLKKEEVFKLLKRITTPTTVYKKQKLDRDDMHDIVDFDVVAWLKKEMRMMLDEEIARAALIGDGRVAGDDHISEDNIRPIWTDSEVYVVNKTIDAAAFAEGDARAKEFIRTMIKARKDYKGSGNPTLFTTEDMLTDCLLLEDMNGRVIYDSVDKLKTTLRAKEIVTVPVMEGQKREVSGKNHELIGIMVNMNDYAFGADKGGNVAMFEDFDIDYNQQKYLIETRCSGALTKPKSAVVIELVTA